MTILARIHSLETRGLTIFTFLNINAVDDEDKALRRPLLGKET